MRALDPKRFEIPSRDSYKLDNMRNAASACDHPELGRKTILVAGTNGKGSTCQYLTEFLIHLGYRVGTYTSPHVVHRGERIRIQGQPLSEKILQKYEKKFEKVLEPLTYFERLTLLAFLIFRDFKVDWQIIEVGIGGRLDATNICEPMASCFAQIDYDHEDVLGNSLSQIAKEKAGILRAGRPGFAVKQKVLVNNVLKAEAKKLDAKLSFSSEASLPVEVEACLEKIEKERGSHQRANAALALNCLHSILDLDEKKFIRAARVALKVPLLSARLQLVRKRPPFLIDGSHNLNSIEALCDFLEKHYSRQKFELIFGVMRDKDAQAMVRKIKKYASRVYLPSFYPERQLEPEAAAALWRGLPVVFPDSSETWISALWSSRSAVLCVGSLYLAGAVLKELEHLRVLPPPKYFE